MAARPTASSRAPRRFLLNPVFIGGMMLVPVLGLSVYSYLQMRTHLTQAALQRRHAVADIAAAMLRERFAGLQELATSLATRPVLREHVAAGQWDEAIALVRTVPDQFPYVDRIFLTSLDGTLQSGAPHVPDVTGKNFAHRDWFRGVAADWQPYVSEIYERAAAPQAAVVAAAAPVPGADGRPVGILVMQIRAERLLAWAKEMGSDQTGTIFFLDPRGYAAAHPGVTPDSAPVSFADRPEWQDALRGRHGAAVVGTGPRASVIGYSPVPDFRWAAVVFEPAASAFADRDRALRLLVTLTMIGMLTGVLLIGVLTVLERARRRQLETSHATAMESLRSATEARQVAERMTREATTARQSTDQAHRNLQLEVQERRGLEAQLRRLWQAIEQTPNLVLITDVTGRIEYVNPSFMRVSGYTADEAVGRTPSILKSGRQGDDVYRDLWSTIRAGREWSGTLCNRRKNGELFWVSTTVAPIKSPEGVVTSFLAIQEDITARRAAEEAAREIEERFRQLAENINEVFWLTDPATTKMLYVSPAYEKVWGRSVQSVYDQPHTFADAVHPEDRPAVERALEQQSRDGVFKAEYRVVRPDGSIRWISDRSFPIRDAAGAVFRVAGIAIDITEQREAEEALRAAQAQLLQAAKMEAVGKLASGIAHDFNNYLSVIHGFAELIQFQHQGDPKLAGQIKEIMHASESGSALIRQLQAFSRRRPAEAAVISLTDGVDRARPLLQQLAGDGVRIEAQLPQTSMLVRLDPTSLEQMLMNLTSNARDAMKREGRLTISIERVRADQAFRATRPWAREDVYVRLTAQDTGSGMTPDVAARLFEPFFTTKQLGQGVGLGLAVVYGLVKQYDGEIEVETAPGHGTALHLYFPHATGAQTVSSPGPPAPAAAAARSTAGRTPRVLVVDDEPGSRQLCQEILQGAYEVVMAASGRDALEAMRAQAPDVLLTDIQMPEMDGVTLIEEALRLYPGLKVAAMSAYMTGEREEKLRALPVSCEIIRKPLAVAGLREALARCLRG